MPERLMLISGSPLPLCYRCTGIYTGVFTSFAYLFIFKRLHGNKPVSLTAAIFSTLCVIPLMFDGFASFTGLYETTNTIRLLTGALFGVNLPIYLILAKNFDLDSKNIDVILNTWEFPIITAISVIISGFRIFPSWHITSLILSITAFSLIWAFAGVLLFRLFRFGRIVSFLAVFLFFLSINMINMH